MNHVAKRRLNNLLALPILLIVIDLGSGCAGTGTKSYNSIAPSLKSNQSGNVYVVREGRFQAAAQIHNIYVNGKSIGKLSQGQMVVFQSPKQSNVIQVKCENILICVGMGKPSMGFEIESGEKAFFLVQVKVGLFSAKIELSQVHENTWKEKAKNNSMKF